jgi:hypothetical protein
VAAQRWWRALQEAWTPGSAGAGADNASGLASRLNELAVNAAVMDRTPSAVPFDGARTFEAVPLSFLPRVLYPEKTNLTTVLNDRFNVTFGFQSREETETSTGAFPLVANGFWSAGWPGVVAVALVSGCLVGFYAGLLRASSWAAAAVAASTFAQLHANSALALQITGVVQQLAGLAALLWAISLVTSALDLLRRPGAFPGLPEGQP